MWLGRAENPPTSLKAVCSTGLAVSAVRLSVELSLVFKVCGPSSLGWDPPHILGKCRLQQLHPGLCGALAILLDEVS